MGVTIQEIENIHSVHEVRYRIKNKLSCSELARKIGVQNINPATNVWRWENGQRIPRKEEMKKIYLGTEKQVQPNDFYDLKI